MYDPRSLKYVLFIVAFYLIATLLLLRTKKVVEPRRDSARRDAGVPAADARQTGYGLQTPMTGPKALKR